MQTTQKTNERRAAISDEPGKPVAPCAGLERSLAHAIRCAQIADEYRGEDTLVLDLTSVTPILDFFVITTAASKRQMNAIADEVDRVLKAEGSSRLGREGREGTSWVLHDYGDIVLHVFTPETRELYDLEHLWADAKQVDWKDQNQDRP
ncbi:MAG: ribosome silencing factor [Planctomycetaceae bacterium]|jgi:ribosome-associated protein|nr:ribosome silencing factor [Planctomycetaceae bacterium]MBT6155166.1 ribosome silencing factor [Planctomycetaceae bacterium]MBT6483318.1 ribosome silencing factor [Planctomycetaceae bacterium]MBT6497481.1 ribosome silencing factor [Planctomycetaceae bacterium]